MLAIGSVSAQQAPPFAVRITSPAEDTYLSGPVRLVAVVEPPSMTSQVKEVVFFADGRRICSSTRVPFHCDWDAGDRVVEHTIRVTAESVKGGRAASTVQTKGVKFAEAVDVDVVQLTAVVTDGGRFVQQPEAGGLQDLRQRPAAEDHELPVREHQPGNGGGARRQLEHARGACRR